MKGVRLSKIFRTAIEKYLQSEKPSYDEKNMDTFDIIEEEFQYRFLRELSHNGFMLRVEGFYPHNYKEKYDVLAKSIEGKPLEIYIELKWSARWKDGFLKNTFNDIEKLDRQKLPPKSIKAFFAFNITDRYKEFPDRWEEYLTPEDLPTHKNTSFRALNNFWKQFKYKKNCIFYLKKYKVKNKYYNTLLFSYVSDVRFL